MFCRPVFFGRFTVIFAAAPLVAVSPMRSQITTAGTRNYVFPPVGLASGETASITVVNTAVPLSVVSPGATSATQPSAPSCTGTISFSNASGAIGTPTSFTVGAEGFQTVTLPFASEGLTGNRGEIVGKISLVASGAPCSLQFSLETYDSTTFATHAVLSNAVASLTQQGSPPVIIPLRN